MSDIIIMGAPREKRFYDMKPTILQDIQSLQHGGEDIFILDNEMIDVQTTEGEEQNGSERNL